MDRVDRRAPDPDDSPRLPREEQREDALRESGQLLDMSEENDGGGLESVSSEEQPPYLAEGDFEQGVGEQAEFRERFDEDLYTDREDRPAQGNTADVAMGDHRFGSDADAYTEYAWRRPGDHHRGDESSVGQARDPADIADEDERP